MDPQQYPPGMDPAAIQAMQDAQDAASGAAAGAMIVMMLIYLPMMILMLTSMMGVFIKADKPWWAAIVPIYNLVVMCEIVGKPVWWVVLMLIPLANIVVMILLTHSLSKSFGKDAGYTAGLLLLSVVFYPMLAFGSAQYQGPAG